MTSTTSARNEVLQRICNRNAGTATRDAAADDWAKIPRSYKCATLLKPGPLLQLFMHRLMEYDATVEMVARPELARKLHEIVHERGVRNMLVAKGFPAEMLPAGEAFTLDDDFSTAALDAFEGIVTEATLAIAETGTLVLQNVPGQGRRAATLVPDFHVCIVRACLVTGTVPEAIRILEATAMLPTTFISGPSATADIEMTRIKGVHGPRFLHVLLVTE